MTPTIAFYLEDARGIERIRCAKIGESFWLYRWDDEGGQCVAPNGSWFHGGHTEDAVKYVGARYGTRGHALTEARKRCAPFGELTAVDLDTAPEPVTKWQDLQVTAADGPRVGTLGEVVANKTADLSRIDLTPTGSIAQWPGYYTSAEGEEPAWDTPNGPVNWSGFAAALGR